MSTNTLTFADAVLEIHRDGLNSIVNIKFTVFDNMKPSKEEIKLILDKIMNDAKL